MPPRATPRGIVRGGGRGSRGGSANASHGATSIQVGLPTSGDHITTVGVKRPGFGTSGQPQKVYVNSFVTTM